jgi:hypothetical protein
VAAAHVPRAPGCIRAFFVSFVSLVIRHPSVPFVFPAFVPLVPLVVPGPRLRVQKLNCPVILTNRAGMNVCGVSQVAPYVLLYVKVVLEFVTL